MNQNTGSIEEWRNHLNIAGEWLTLGCIACYSVPGYSLRLGFILIVLVLFACRVNAQKGLYPSSLKELIEKRKRKTITEAELDLLKSATRKFFGGTVYKDELLPYTIGTGVFIFTAVHAWIMMMSC